MKNSLLTLTLLFSVFITNSVEAKSHKAKIVPIHKTTHATKVVKPVKVKSPKKSNYVGMASFYHPKFNGRKTASGEIYNQNALTAAHRSLPLKSKVKVTNLKNKKSVVVRITDRGPWVHNRIMDLSKRAAVALDIGGVEKVSLAVVN